jgi:hypothetical protein
MIDNKDPVWLKIRHSLTAPSTKNFLLQEDIQEEIYVERKLQTLKYSIVGAKPSSRSSSLVRENTRTLEYVITVENAWLVKPDFLLYIFTLGLGLDCLRAIQIIKAIKQIGYTLEVATLNQYTEKSIAYEKLNNVRLLTAKTSLKFSLQQGIVPS